MLLHLKILFHEPNTYCFCFDGVVLGIVLACYGLGYIVMYIGCLVCVVDVRSLGAKHLAIGYI